MSSLMIDIFFLFDFFENSFQCKIAASSFLSLYQQVKKIDEYEYFSC